MHKSILFILLLSGCASMMPREQRQVEYIIQTGIPAAEAYTKALAWLSRNLNNANYSIQLRDPDNKRILANTGFNVDEGLSARSWGAYRISFTLEFEARDGRIRIAFTDVQKIDRHPSMTSVNYPTNPEELDEIASRYLIGIRDALTEGLKAPERAW